MEKHEEKNKVEIKQYTDTIYFKIITAMSILVAIFIFILWKIKGGIYENFYLALASLLGGLIGGIGTLMAVIITIEQSKKQQKDEFRNNQKILVIKEILDLTLEITYRFKRLYKEVDYYKFGEGREDKLFPKHVKGKIYKFDNYYDLFEKKFLNLIYKNSDLLEEETMNKANEVKKLFISCIDDSIDKEMGLERAKSVIYIFGNNMYKYEDFGKYLDEQIKPIIENIKKLQKELLQELNQMYKI